MGLTFLWYPGLLVNRLEQRIQSNSWKLTTRHCTVLTAIRSCWRFSKLHLKVALRRISSIALFGICWWKPLFTGHRSMQLILNETQWGQWWVLFSIRAQWLQETMLSPVFSILIATNIFNGLSSSDQSLSYCQQQAQCLHKLCQCCATALKSLNLFTLLDCFSFHNWVNKWGWG